MPGLVAHEGVGFVSVLGADGPVAIGSAGRHHLAAGIVEGVDPLLPFERQAAARLLAATSMPEAPDIYVNSALDADTLDVAAFEPLRGVPRRARRVAGLQRSAWPPSPCSPDRPT